MSVKSGNCKEIAISWINLSYNVKDYLKKEKSILQQLNGSFEYHSLNGLMGPSGSGKTTLLNCLSDNLRFGISENSQIYLSKNDQHSIVSCFIEQNVHRCIVGRLTIFEILNYAFKFKNGITVKESDIKKHIFKIIDELMLLPSLLDKLYENCSGGEQKRIAIAQELMSLIKPSLMFIDEPTTGLDSAAAYEMIKCLKGLTIGHRIAVIASIHQPNNEVLDLFDKLYVLAKGGVCIYSGIPRAIKKKLSEKLEFSTEQPPIDVLLKFACKGFGDQNVIKLAQLVSSEEHERIQNRLDEVTPGLSRSLNRQKAFLLKDLYLQCSRMFRITFIANFKTFALNICLFIINFIFVATIFNSTAIGNGCILSNKNAVASCNYAFEQETLYKENLFNIAYTFLYVGFILAYSTTSIYSDNVKIFRNEHRNHWYSLGVFYWSSMLINLLEVTLIGIITSSLGYFLTYQASADNTINLNRFGHYSFFMLLLCIYVQNFGQLFGVLLADNHEMAIISTLVYYCFVSMANGIFVNLERNTNSLLQFGTSAVALKYISKGILYSIYGLDRCNPDTEYSVILLFFNVNENELFNYIMWILANTFAFRLTTFLCLYLKFSNYQDYLFNPIKLIENCFQNYDNSPEICNQETLQKNNNNNKIVFQIQNQQSTDKTEASDFSHNKILIGWRNLSLYEPQTKISNYFNVKNESRKILSYLNGQFCFSTLNALMGPSGAGKTSLLKVLNGQCNQRLTQDTCLYLSKFVKIQSCFISQDVSDHLLVGLTVKQLLIYSSKLKNKNNYNEKVNSIKIDHNQIVLELLDKLALTENANTKVESCSGGERKRIALALELVSLQMPNIIFIDEPTSGLDSNSAEMIISCLRKLVDIHNITIVTSIHQPNIEILKMFDKLYVLAKGGTCIYSGGPTQIVPQLSSLSEFNSNEFFYPIERLILISCGGQKDEKEIFQNMTQIHNNRILNVDEKLMQETQLASDGIFPNRIRFSTYSVYILFQRYLSYFKGYHWKFVSFFAVNYILYGLFLKFFYDFKIVHVSGCINIYENSDFNCTRSADDVSEIFDLNENTKYTFFFSIIYMLFIFSQSSLNFRNELPLFYNEHRNGWYSTGSYYLMKTISEVIIVLPINFIYAYICCYYYESVRPGLFWQLAFVLYLSTIGLQGMSHIFAILSDKNLYLQTILSSSTILFSILLGNLYLPYYKLHYIYQFVANFSIVRFCFEAMIILQYGFDRCGQHEVQAIFYMMHLEDHHLSKCIIMLILNLILFRIVSIYLLIRKVNPGKTQHLYTNNIESNELTSTNVITASSSK